MDRGYNNKSSHEGPDRSQSTDGLEVGGCWRSEDSKGLDVSTSKCVVENG